MELAESAARWRENACVLLANKLPGDGVALMRLSDALLNAGRPEAAHVWYARTQDAMARTALGGAKASLHRPISVLSMMHSTSALLATWATDVSQAPALAQPLVGAALHTRPTVLDVDAIHLTELVAYLRSLAHPTAGPTSTVTLAAAAAGQPHAAGGAGGGKQDTAAPVVASALLFSWFQPWLLSLAGLLADCGFTGEALAYCEAITATVKRWPKGVGAPPAYSAAFFGRLTELDARLRAAGAVSTVAGGQAATAAGSGSGGGTGGWLKLEGWKDLFERGLDLVVGDKPAEPAQPPAPAPGGGHRAGAPPALQASRMGSVPMFPGASMSAFGSSTDLRTPPVGAGPAAPFTTSAAVPLAAPVPLAPTPASTAQLTGTAAAPQPTAAAAKAAEPAPPADSGSRRSSAATDAPAARDRANSKQRDGAASDADEKKETDKDKEKEKGKGKDEPAPGLLQRVVGGLFGFGKPKNVVKLGSETMTMRYDPVLKRWVNDSDPDFGKDAALPPPPPPTSGFQRRPTAEPAGTPAPPSGEASQASSSNVTPRSTSMAPDAPMPAGTPPSLGPSRSSSVRRGGARARYVDVMNPNGANPSANSSTSSLALPLLPTQPMIVDASTLPPPPAEEPAAAEPYTSYYGAGGHFESEIRQHEQVLHEQAHEPPPPTATAH